MTAPGEPLDGLVAAARLFAARAAAPDPEPIAEFLQRHAALREWLEPMLLGEADGDETEDPPPEAPRIGPYRVGREIGRGGMGVVYEAYDSEGGAVALKVLPDFLALREATAARFEREADLARRLHHPGVVRVLASGTDGGARYLAMELVAGAPLDRVLTELRGCLPQALTGADLARAVVAAAVCRESSADPAPAEAFAGTWVAAVARIGIQVAEALAHAHGAGVIHRDVKPSNILVRADGSVVLTDFGLARDAGPSNLTLTGDFAGTPFYVSPEQAMAKRVNVDHRTDLFSLGSTLYELLTLRRAFDGETTQEVFARILTKEPVVPTRFHPGLASDLVTVLFKLLEKDPDRRYAAAADVAADLRAFLEYRPVVAQRASAVTRVLRWSRREPLKAALVAVLAAGVPTLAAGAGYLYARADEIRAGRAQLLAQEVEARVEDGFLGLMLERPDMGIPRFESTLALAPDAAEAQIGLVFALLRRDGPEAALARLDRGLAAHVAPGLLARMRMAVLLRLGRREDAKALENGLPEARSEFELFLEGILTRDRGDSAGTRLIEFTERAVLAAPRPLLWLHIHWAAYADEARDASSCRRCAANLLLNWPDSPFAQYFATVALRNVEPDQAATIVERALRARPDVGLLHAAQGMVCKARRDRDGALAAFTRAAELEPQIPSFQYMLGSARLDAGDGAGAVTALEAACALSPNFIAGWLGLGMVQAAQGDLDGAAASLRRAVDLHPTQGEARFQLGEVLLQRGDIAAGLDELRQAVRLHSRDPHKALRLAAALTQHGDPAAGETTLRSALRVTPAHEALHRALVQHLRTHGTTTALRAALLAWTEAVPKSPDAWLALAEHCLADSLPAAERDAPSAVWAARRALALTTEASGLAWYRLGEAQAALEGAAAARAAWQRALAAPDALPEALQAACRARLDTVAGR